MIDSVVASEIKPVDVKQNQDDFKGADFLSFDLAEELYGIDIKMVEEIRVWEPPTPIPRSPDFILGVINLRGMIVPIMDLRVRFSMGEIQYLPTTVVLILKSSEQYGGKTMGVVVDSVSDVIDMKDKKINIPIGGSVVIPFVDGLLNVQDKVMSLLDVNALLDIESLIH